LAPNDGDDSDDRPETKVKETQDKESQDQVLLRLAAGATLVHTPDGEAYARVKVGDHDEVHPVRGPSFRRWLTKACYDATGRAPLSEAMQKALGVIEALAHFEGQEVPVYTRLAVWTDPADPGNPPYYVDLGDPERRAVKVTREGWTVVPSAEVPVWFRRPGAMAALPEPICGGSIEELRPFINIASDHQWHLLVATITAYLCPVGPFPVLVIGGEQGSAKSTTARVIRKLIDPNSAPLRTAPRNEQDLMISAKNSWMLNYDNLDGLPIWLSNALCRMSTGGGHAVRQLYTNDDEIYFDFQRPVVLNGIEDVATRGDLVDRAVAISLSAIPDKDRREESEFWRLFDAARPRILGALLDGVSGMLRLRPSVKLGRRPRMADFARQGEALGRALGWGEGVFLAAYEASRGEANEAVLEASSFALAVREFHQKNHPEWIGTTPDLLRLLGEIAGEPTTRSGDWPKTPNALGGRLRRFAPVLRRIGIEVERLRTAKKRQIVIRAAGGSKVGETLSSLSSLSSATPDGAATDNPHNGFGAGSGSPAPQATTVTDRHHGSDDRHQGAYSGHRLSPSRPGDEHEKSLLAQCLDSEWLQPPDSDDGNDDLSPTLGEPTPPDWEYDEV
jgi:hypothetical protein